MIVGKNVYLNAISPKDLETVLFWRNQPRVYQWFYEREPITVKQQLEWYENISKSSTDKFLGIYSNNSMAIIGAIGLAHIDYRNRKAEFGRFFVDPSYKGKGIGKEALSLLIDYAFNHLNLRKLYCDTFSKNKPAITLYKKLGFVEGGLFKEHIYSNGNYEDLMYLELIKK